MYGMVLVNILEEHFEEADFLWHQRRKAVEGRHSDLTELVKIEERLLAHLDGLTLGGSEVWSLIHPESVHDDSGEVFVASLVAFESGDESRVKDVMNVANASPKISRGVISALGWIPFPQVRTVLEGLVHSESTGFRHIGIAGFAVHRQDPGRTLSLAAATDNPVLKARALKAMGELGRMDLLPAVKGHLNAEGDKCRFIAAWSAALLGDAGAVPILGSFAEQGDMNAKKAADLAFRRMDIKSAHIWQRSLTDKVQTHRIAVISAGVIGDPVLIPWLIKQMALPELARVAGEAFTMITGADVSSQDLKGEKPEGIEGRSPEELADENMEMDADEELPWPNPESIQKWWAMHRSEFQTGVRHLIGKPITEAWLWQVLKTGKQRQRAAAAIELAILQPGRPIFNVKAPAFRQMELLASMKTS
jgi:uncharacterized protein (TIGR02270 family)